jgi:hypothetical protein
MLYDHRRFRRVGVEPVSERQTVSGKCELAKLSDAELIQRLEGAWQSYENADKMLASRTRIRPPRFSRFWTTLTGSPGFRVIDWGLRFGIAAYFRTDVIRQHLLVQDEAIEMDDKLCEIRDIMNEMESRVAQRKEGAS